MGCSVYLDIKMFRCIDVSVYIYVCVGVGVGVGVGYQSLIAQWSAHCAITLQALGSPPHSDKFHWEFRVRLITLR